MAKHTTLLFNKPFNVLCQFTAVDGRKTLANYIQTPGVYAAGRLDYNSEGLLLLTSDGALNQRITHPRRKMPKTYWAQVEGAPQDVDLTPLRQGVSLNDGPCKPCEAELIEAPEALWPRDPPIRVRQQIPDQWLAITLTEGRNRQVRRMCAAIGFPVLRLIRASIGPWSLQDLAPGESRVLDPSAINATHHVR